MQEVCGSFTSLWTLVQNGLPLGSRKGCRQTSFDCQTLRIDVPSGK